MYYVQSQHKLPRLAITADKLDLHRSDRTVVAVFSNPKVTKTHWFSADETEDEIVALIHMDVDTRIVRHDCVAPVEPVEKVAKK